MMQNEVPRLFTSTQNSLAWMFRASPPAGDSAGGHLALVTALRLKAKAAWQPAQLILIYPMLDPTASMASYLSNGDDYVITRDTLLSGYEMYLASTPANHPDACPLWREDFNGLPPVHILTAEFDPLRDEGEVLYRRLTEQGVESSCQRYLGVIHGFFQLGGVSNAARDAMRDIARRVASPRTITAPGAYSSSLPPSSYEPKGFAGNTM